MLVTKYGEFNNECFESYRSRMINMIFKILPLREEECNSLDIYIDSLIYELVGFKSLFYEIENNGALISLISTLENLKSEENVEIVKREVFKSIKLMKGFQQNGLIL